FLARPDHEDAVTRHADEPGRRDQRVEGIAHRHLEEAHGDHAGGLGRDDEADAIPLGERAEGGLDIDAAKIDGRPIGRESLSPPFFLRLGRRRRQDSKEGEGDRGGKAHLDLLVVGAGAKPGSRMDLEPPPGSLRTILSSMICSTRRPLTTSPILTTWSSTMARAPPGNFIMTFPDTGTIGRA